MKITHRVTYCCYMFLICLQKAHAHTHIIVKTWFSSGNLKMGNSNRKSLGSNAKEKKKKKIFTIREEEKIRNILYFHSMFFNGHRIKLEWTSWIIQSTLFSIENKRILPIISYLKSHNMGKKVGTCQDCRENSSEKKIFHIFH